MPHNGSTEIWETGGSTQHPRGLKNVAERALQRSRYTDIEECYDIGSGTPLRDTNG